MVRAYINNSYVLIIFWSLFSSNAQPSGILFFSDTPLLLEDTQNKKSDRNLNICDEMVFYATHVHTSLHTILIIVIP